MTWAKLLANNTVTKLPATKSEIDNQRSIVTRSLSDVAAAGYRPRVAAVTTTPS
jgi:hypothetical protein